jgi:ectoine hydroxylase-related dioxygenase (phytanoyl-CoA dioxygenase family)
MQVIHEIEHRNRYERDGFVLVASVFSPSECADFKQEALRLLAQDCEKQKRQQTVVLGASANSRLFYDLSADPRMLALLKPLMPDGIMFLSDKLVFKSKAQRFPTPWHIDRFYWAETRSKLSVWIALDAATAGNGALKVVRGSHRREWRFRNGDLAATNGEFPRVLEPSSWDVADEIICAAAVGDCIVFPDTLVHASCANVIGKDRYSLISTFHAPAPDDAFDVQFPARHVVWPSPALIS